jgi:hypothetical protein
MSQKFKRLILMRRIASGAIVLAIDARARGDGCCRPQPSSAENFISACLSISVSSRKHANATRASSAFCARADMDVERGDVRYRSKADFDQCPPNVP